MTWNYRLVKKSFKGCHCYEIHEVYYNKKGEPTMMTEDPIDFCYCEHEGDDKDAKKCIISDMKRALKTIKKYPIFVPPEKWEKDED